MCSDLFFFCCVRHLSSSPTCLLEVILWRLKTAYMYLKHVWVPCSYAKRHRGGERHHSTSTYPIYYSCLVYLLQSSSACNKAFRFRLPPALTAVPPRAHTLSTPAMWNCGFRLVNAAIWIINCNKWSFQALCFIASSFTALWHYRNGKCVRDRLSPLITEQSFVSSVTPDLARLQ